MSRQSLLLSLFYTVSTLIIVEVQSTNVKWSGNNDPNAPEAAKVPRSQKYWDENNIERPDYAKTDAEILQERFVKMKSETDGMKMFFVIALFVGIWLALAYKFVFAKGGQKLGSSSSKIGTGLSHEEKLARARNARLARFEALEAKDD